MNQFSKEDFEQLAAIKGENCISIFIPTHASGIETMEGLDRINLKGKLQEVKTELEKRGVSDASNILSKANKLLEDGAFWRMQDESLALFFNAKTFKVFKLPIKINDFVSVGQKFELSPLLPLLAENESYYLLSLDLGKIQLFKNTRYTSKKIKIPDVVPDSLDEALSYFNFNNESQVKNTNFEGMKFNSVRNQGQATHSFNSMDKETRYVQDFLSKVERSVSNILMNDDNLPLVLAGSDNICGYYKDTSSYINIESKTLGSIDRLSEQELLDEGLKVVEKSLNKEKRKAIEKYPVWAGTGKTSYDLETIVNAANDGQIESLFVLSDTHLWGTFDEKTRKINVHNNQEKGDVCLIDLAVMKTIENSGRAYMVNKNEMPEKLIDDAIIAATFRY